MTPTHSRWGFGYYPTHAYTVGHMSKRILIALFMVLSLVIGPFMTSSAQAVVANTLVKIDGNATVYWYASNGRRYVFPNPRTFYSWFTEADLARVLTISPQELGSITIGGNVTYRPGVRLVKITTDPRVYAVGRYGQLRWITSEALAVQLYGANWARMVDDVPDEFFTNYRVGEPVYTSAQFNVQFEQDQARSPSENIPPSDYSWPTQQPTYPNYPQNNGSLSGQIVLQVSNSNPVVVEPVTFTATASNVNAAVQNITTSIFSSDTGELLRSCAGFSCSYTGINAYTQSFSQNHVGNIYRYYARVTNIVTGARLDSSVITVTPRNSSTNTNNQATAHTITFDRSSVRPGESFTVTSRLTPDNGNAPYYTIRIYDQWNVLQLTCQRVRTCVLQQTLAQTSDTSRTYYASAVADTGHSIGSGNATIQVLQSGQSSNARLGNSRLTLGVSSQNTITLTPNMTVPSGSEVRISADVTPALQNPTGLTMKFYDSQGNLLFTCSNYNSCSTTKVVTNNGSQDMTVGFKVRVEDTYGSWYEAPLSYVIVRPQQTTPDYSNSVYNRTFELSPSNTTIRSGEVLTLTARVSPQTGSASGFMITISNQLGTVLKTCSNAFTCVVDQPSYNNSSLETFSARVTSSDGHWNSASTPVITFVNTQPAVITGRVGLGISHSSIGSNQQFTLNARVIDSNVSDSNLKIAWYQSSNDALITTCQGTNPCLVTTSYPAINSQSRTMSFYARAWDRTGVQGGDLRSDTDVSITITP